MKKPKITEGEWVTVKASGAIIGVGAKTDVQGYTQMICNSILPDSQKQYAKEKAEIEANMGLIAAAPLLGGRVELNLEEFEMILENIQEGRTISRGWLKARIDGCKDTLKKAGYEF